MFYTFFSIFEPSLGTISHNVPAVTDVFLRPMRKNAKHFYGRKKMWRSKIPQRGVAPTGILRSLAAERRRTVTDLLCAVMPYFIFTYYLLKYFLEYYFIRIIKIFKSTYFFIFHFSIKMLCFFI